MADTLADLERTRVDWRAAVLAEDRAREAECMKRLNVLLDRLIEASRPAGLYR